MEYLNQIAAYPSLLIGPVVIGAVVSGLVAIWVGWRNRLATSSDIDRKIKAEREANDAKLAHESRKALTDRAWADYGLRRDIYLDLAAQIDCLFQNEAGVVDGVAEAPRTAGAFHETARKVRLIGSDDVVVTLNSLTAAIKGREPPAATAKAYGKLMNAIRRDIRKLNETPP